MPAPRIVVIGGGPAGLATAIRCRSAGIDTLLVRPLPVDDGLQPSEAVHPGMERLLTELGVPDALARCSRGTYSGIRGDGTFRPLGEDERGPWIGHHIDRREFDELLLARARDVGAEVIEAKAESLLADGERVVGVRVSNGVDVVGTLVVDATGERRLAARAFDREPRFFSPPLLVRTGLVAEMPLAHTDPTFTADADGWTWLAPEASGRCTWTRLDRRSGARKLPEVLLGAEQLCEPRAVNMRWRLHDPVVANGVIMVGDAAGLLDPAAGQGALFAVWSAVMAGQALERAVRSPLHAREVLQSYDDWFRTSYERRAAELARHYSTLGIQT